ncbi:MAG: hypothetical protein ACR5KV_02640 [Wolbachia sp.]
MSTEKDESKDYRLFAKEIFKQMFRYAQVEAPSDSILEKLITNCNQVGYCAALFVRIQFALG